MTGGYSTVLRGGLIVVGCALIGIALGAVKLGLGSPGSFGSGRVLLIFLGGVIILIGFRGSEIKGVHQRVSSVLLNSLLLLFCLELGAIGLVRSGLFPTHQARIWARYLDLPYYRDQEWAEEYWREAGRTDAYRYEPFVVWRHRPFEGVHINISQQGIRQTPGADCRSDAFKVYTFGGSSMWGWGSPDWGTIASYLQEDLRRLVDRPVCVVNHGQDAYVSTQNLVALMLQLQAGNLPDAVVFYDGVNDVHAAFESGQAGKHYMLNEFAKRVEARENGLFRWMRESRLYWMAEHLVRMSAFGDSLIDRKKLSVSGNGGDSEQLARSTTKLYLGNYEAVKSLAGAYGFQHFFFWQPHLAAGRKVLTEEERTIKSEMDAGLANFAKKAYAQMKVTAPAYESLWYIADVFSDVQEQVWIDASGHITPDGNRIVSRAMLDLIEDRLSEN